MSLVRKEHSYNDCKESLAVTSLNLLVFELHQVSNIELGAVKKVDSRPLGFKKDLRIFRTLYSLQLNKAMSRQAKCSRAFGGFILDPHLAGNNVCLVPEKYGPSSQ